MRSNTKIEQRSLFDPAAYAGPAAEEAGLLFELPAGVPKTAEPPKPFLKPCRENSWTGIADLASLRKEVLSCRGCGLRAGARGVVFGEGDPCAGVMFVGEGPGQTEDETGRPFVGRAGQLLDTMLLSAGFARKAVYIANIVKCRPPDNRLPLPPEVEACLPNLLAQMRIIGPKIVVLLGALASQTLVNPGIRVTRDRGKWFHKGGIDYLVTFHPAAVLRDEANKKRLMWEDFQSLKAKWEDIQSGRGKGS